MIIEDNWKMEVNAMTLNLKYIELFQVDFLLPEQLEILRRKLQNMVENLELWYANQTCI